MKLRCYQKMTKRVAVVKSGCEAPLQLSIRHDTMFPDLCTVRDYVAGTAWPRYKADVYIGRYILIPL